MSATCSGQPYEHGRRGSDLRPPLAHFFQHVLAGLFAHGRQDCTVEIVADGLLVALIQLLGVVVRRLLRAPVKTERPATDATRK